MTRSCHFCVWGVICSSFVPKMRLLLMIIYAAPMAEALSGLVGLEGVRPFYQRVWKMAKPAHREVTPTDIAALDCAEYVVKPGDLLFIPGELRTRAHTQASRARAQDYAHDAPRLRFRI